MWTQQGKVRVDELKDHHGNIYITICKIDSKWEFAVLHRELNLELCDNLERGMGWEMGEVFRREGGVCMPVADSC